MNEDYVHGINKMKKPATKVMAPPGGKTSINLFGGSDEQPQHSVNKNQAHRNHSSIFGGPEPKVNPAPAQATAPAAQPTQSSAAAAAPTQTPAEAPATKANNSKAPPVTGTGKPSTKVMAPPGGKTSINLFG